jgi:hypothetical protein
MPVGLSRVNVKTMSVPHIVSTVSGIMVRDDCPPMAKLHIYFGSGVFFTVGQFASARLMFVAVFLRHSSLHCRELLT